MKENNPVKRLLSRWFPIYFERRKISGGFVLMPDSYIYKTGWRLSFVRKDIVSAEGDPIPWMNHGIVEILRDRLNGEMSLFEYGSGYSTMFYSKLVHHVVSIEYDSSWHEKITEDLAKNVKLRLVGIDRNGKYCRAILDEPLDFDVVVVDGRDRVNCVKQAIKKLKGGGVIILDDSNREQYKEAFAFLTAQGFRHLSIEGLKNGFFTLDQTTVFYRDGNCLAI